MAPLPYEVQAGDNGLKICFPSKVIQNTYIFTAFLDNLIFGSTIPIGNRQIVTFDELSVTMRWKNGIGEMEVPLVRGMAYVTIFYTNLTPKISTIHAILNVNDQPSPQPGTEFSGENFSFEMNNGQKWNLYTSTPVTLVFIGVGEGFEFKEAYTGSVRAAINTSPEVSLILDQYSNKIPIGKKLIVMPSVCSTYL